jgi:hypothetical protein
VSERVVITGVPRSGKTTLALALAKPTLPVLYGDGKDWLNAPGPWIIEGDTIPTTLRSWLMANGNGKPCDRVFWLAEPKVTLSAAERASQQDLEALWREVGGLLRQRGVTIEEV